ncbi:hypothetical protein SLEP1_g228 [Rubroshorea leprosula]|uniref:Uncharacterized protein n=1 Tax=Rubroshorea leprosula TaxID=152421 RepID=A0AAV5HIL2_9ROSI|nr:hypothetical protein SLEP1_g228 [Rubroshorea leprosula]
MWLSPSCYCAVVAALTCFHLLPLCRSFDTTTPTNMLYSLFLFWDTFDVV